MPDRWILSRLAHCVAQCNAGFQSYNFRQLTTALYHFWYYEFCDVYLEAVKPVLQTKTADDAVETSALISRHILHHCVDAFLRLAAPIMPFITEELWQRLPRRATERAESICVAVYPYEEKYSFYDKEAEENAELIRSIAIAKERSKAAAAANSEADNQCGELENGEAQN